MGNFDIYILQQLKIKLIMLFSLNMIPWMYFC